jgi:hypothetical protein
MSRNITIILMFYHRYRFNGNLPCELPAWLEGVFQAGK